MKKILLPFMAIAIVAIVSISCEHAEKNHSEDATTASEQKYTCPMHSEVISDKPGVCPKCGMDLVKKSASEPMDMKHDSMMHRDSTMNM